MGVFVVVGGGMFAEGQSRWSLTDSGGQIKTSVSVFGGVCCQYREE